jgi:glycerol-3-phosphate dehydrogenase
MKSTLSARNPCFRNLAGNDPLDVLIVGGGMSGAPLYHELCGRGYRVGLIDKGDFSSGTSQASGMLVWGGRYPEGMEVPDCGGVSLPATERANGSLIRLPNFCHPESAPLIHQYAEAFRRVLG